jgi:hypothetical protein
MRSDRQILHPETRVALKREPRGGAATLTVRFSSTVSFDRVLCLSGTVKK